MQLTKREPDLLDYAVDFKNKEKELKKENLHMTGVRNTEDNLKTTRQLNTEEVNKVKKIMELFDIKTRDKAVEGLVS